MSHSDPGEARGTIPITAQSHGCLTFLKKTDVRTFVNAIVQVINSTPLAVSDPGQGASSVRGAGLADAVGPAGARSVEESAARIEPAPVLCLLLTVVLLFGFRGQVILALPLLMAPKAVPIILQSDGIFAFGSAWAWSWKLSHKLAAPLALIGTSNCLESAQRCVSSTPLACRWPRMARSPRIPGCASCAIWWRGARGCSGRPLSGMAR
jgi:hypothetical protein